MKIGAMNHPARNPLEEIDWFGRQGFDFVDFTLEPPAADPDRIDPGAVRAALDRHGLGVVAHTACYLPFGSPFASIREACLGEFRRALRAAHQIGATVMNVHYGKSPGFFSKEQVIEWHVGVLSRLCQEAAEVGMTVVLEHIPHGGGEQLETSWRSWAGCRCSASTWTAAMRSWSGVTTAGTSTWTASAHGCSRPPVGERRHGGPALAAGGGPPKYDRLAAARQEAEGDRLRRHDYPGGLRTPPGVSATKPGLVAPLVGRRMMER